MTFKKPKLKSIFLGFTTVFVLAITVFFANSNPAKADLSQRNFGVDDIGVKIDPFKPGDFFRVLVDKDGPVDAAGTGSGPIKITASLSMVKPDKLYISGYNAGGVGWDNLYVDKVMPSARQIVGFGLIYTNADPATLCSGGVVFSTNVRSCSQKLAAPYLITSNAIFPVYLTINANEPASTDIVLDKATRESYGINKASDTGQINTLYVFPYVGYSNWLLPGSTEAAYVSSDLVRKINVKVYANTDAGKAAYLADKDKPPDTTDNTGGSGTLGGTGSTLADILNRILTYYILAHVRIIYWAFSNVVAPLIESLLQVHPYQDVFVEAIYLGWQLIRNLCNIFFIVILLVIGLGTLFRLESYNYKHLLVKVVIAALLVNFSLVFGQAVLGVADTVQQQFLPDSTNVIRALGSKLMVEPINKLTDSSNFSTGNATTAGASFANLTKPIFALALALGAFFTFLALAAFLVIRIVALWILLLVSPLAYVANVLPQTASYTRSWWTHFLKYAFMTPVLAFFLNLSAVFVTTMLRDQGTFSQLLASQKVSGEISQFVYLAGSQILTILFILVGLKAASSSGTYGGQAVANFAEKGMRKPFEWYGKAAKAGGAAAADRANRYKTDQAMRLIERGEGKGGLQGGALKALGMALTPKRQYEGYKAQDTEKKEAQEKQVKGQAFDTFRKGIKVRGRTLLGGGPVSDEYFSTLDHEAAHHADHMKDKDEEYQVQELLHGMHQGSGNTRMTQQAGSLLALAQANGLNTAMDRYSEDANNHFEKTGELSKDILNFMKAQVEHGIFSEDYAARVLESINGVGFSKRNQALMGLTYRDKSGNLKIRDTESAKDMKDMYEYQTAQRRKWEPQDIARNGHHSAIAEKDSQNRYIMSGGAAHFIVDADETNYKNATRVNKAQKIKYEGALSEDPKAVEKVAKAFREQNPNMTEADSLARAADKIALFRKNYLQGQAAPSTPAPAGQTFTPNANPNPASVNDDEPKIVPSSDFERKEPRYRKTF